MGLRKPLPPQRLWIDTDCSALSTGLAATLYIRRKETPPEISDIHTTYVRPTYGLHEIEIRTERRLNNFTSNMQGFKAF